MKESQSKLNPEGVFKIQGTFSKARTLHQDQIKDMALSPFVRTSEKLKVMSSGLSQLEKRTSKTLNSITS